MDSPLAKTMNNFRDLTHEICLSKSFKIARAFLLLLFENMNIVSENFYCYFFFAYFLDLALPGNKVNNKHLFLFT
jgi:hypothetical protein